MLRFQDLSKSFGPKAVIQAASATLGPGVYALQGANGSGKSTLLALLAGALAPDAGEAWIAGASLMREPVRARMHLSYAPDESPVYPFMTGWDFLELVAQAKRSAVVGEVLRMADEMGLPPHGATRFDAMSLGTQKKFLLCAAWIGPSPVMLLDEPSNGLDHATRAVLARRIAERSSHGLTLFVSHDAAFVADCGAQILPLDALTGPRAMG
jgi:ABC-2 type transport system ATP-binding protein